MNEINWDDRAFYDDGEWVTWSEIDQQFRYKEWQAKYPLGRLTEIPYFESLMSLAESYYHETGLHLSVYGDIGELFGAITYGIKLNKTYAQGSDGRIGNDHVEIKTITPFKTKDEVVIDRLGNFNKLLVVKINEVFDISGRMIDRKELPKGSGRYLRVKWRDLAPAQNT